MSADRRRALVLRRGDSDTVGLEQLIDRYGLEVVFTVVVDTIPKLAAMIAVHHLLEHDAEVVVVPDLTSKEIRADRPWHAVVGLTDLVTSDGMLECGSIDPSALH